MMMKNVNKSSHDRRDHRTSLAEVNRRSQLFTSQFFIEKIVELGNFKHKSKFQT